MHEWINQWMNKWTNEWIKRKSPIFGRVWCQNELLADQKLLLITTLFAILLLSSHIQISSSRLEGNIFGLWPCNLSELSCYFTSPFEGRYFYPHLPSKRIRLPNETKLPIVMEWVFASPQKSRTEISTSKEMELGGGASGGQLGHEEGAPVMGTLSSMWPFDPHLAT